MKLDHRFLRMSIIRTISQSLLVGLLTTASLISNTLVFSSTADAQSPTVTSNELTSYARALLKMEPQRQLALDEIKKIIGDKDLPKIVCNESSSFSSLPNKAKDIAVNYCQRSLKIVEENGLTFDRFNKITVEVQNNEELKRQIYNRLLDLQKTTKSR